MNPDYQKTIDDLVRRIEALEKEVASHVAQQVRLPLDLASIEVLKAALIRAGFTFP